MKYRRKLKVKSPVSLGSSLTPLQFHIFTSDRLLGWVDYGTVVNTCKPYPARGGVVRNATNIEVGRALNSLVNRGLLDIRR